MRTERRSPALGEMFGKSQEPGDWQAPSNPARFGSDATDHITNESQERTGHTVLQPLGQGLHGGDLTCRLSALPRKSRCARMRWAKLRAN
jgi:hypothetical protein